MLKRSRTKSTGPQNPNPQPLYHVVYFSYPLGAYALIVEIRNYQNSNKTKQGTLDRRETNVLVRSLGSCNEDGTVGFASMKLQRFEKDYRLTKIWRNTMERGCRTELELLAEGPAQSESFCHCR